MQHPGSHHFLNVTAGLCPGKFNRAELMLVCRQCNRNICFSGQITVEVQVSSEKKQFLSLQKKVVSGVHFPPERLLFRDMQAL